MTEVNSETTTSNQGVLPTVPLANVEGCYTIVPLFIPRSFYTIVFNESYTQITFQRNFQVK